MAQVVSVGMTDDSSDKGDYDDYDDD